MDRPLMPKATAAWLVEHTSLSFEQIADFCALSLPEVQGIADGEVAQRVRPRSPLASGELTAEEIERCQSEPTARLQIRAFEYDRPLSKKGHRYTPLIKRHNKPDAIAWILKYHPELSDRQITRLIGTTAGTISSIRDRTHRNMAHIRAADPVALGLCSQVALNQAVQEAGRQSRGGKGITDGDST